MSNPTQIDNLSFEPSDGEEDQVTTSTTTHGYWVRFREEIAFQDSTTDHDAYGSMFGLRDFDGGILDVAATFAPTPVRKTGAIRLVMLVLTTGYTFWAWFHWFPRENHFIYMGYLTKLVGMATPPYQFLALWITLRRNHLRQPSTDEDAKLRPSWLVRVTWAFYSTLSTLHVLINILFWPAPKGGRPITFETVMDHGILGLMVLMDGHVLQRYPIRLRQIVFLLIFGLLYILWTLIHDLGTDIGDGDWSFEDENDPTEDSLYSILSWRTDWSTALGTSLLTLFVILPLLYWFLWTLSLLSEGFKLDGSHFHHVPKDLAVPEKERDRSHHPSSGPPSYCFGLKFKAKVASDAQRDVEAPPAM